MTGYLLDTNHLSDAIKPVSRVRERIEQARRSGRRIGTCVPVLCELEVGLERVSRREPYRRALGHLLTRVRIWPIEREVAGHYGVIFHELRHRGRALSQEDMMLAALTRVMDLTLLTSDQDFEALPDLRRDSWLNAE
jgi:tRNA(fMet)-specific endonuclease VapC